MRDKNFHNRPVSKKKFMENLSDNQTQMANIAKTQFMLKNKKLPVKEAIKIQMDI
ncbi:MAG TPA: hypothetical protein VLN45_11550 [Ignavibacteriaceae bacterium]|nr:hypothetical protein [Ignavibacteriaceae bacterium]